MRVVAVLSGKGGVGKTTTCVGLSLALKELGFRPALLDLDLENPSLAGRDGVTGLTKTDLAYPGDLIVPPRWADIPVMSVSMLPPDDFEDTPAMIDESRKHFMIRHLVKEVDWGDTEVLVVDMPPGSGEEVRGLLQTQVDGAVVVTSPQRISEAAVRKVLVMAGEYRIPVVGLIENTPNGVPGEAGARLAEHFGLPVLAQVPWTVDILESMECHQPFDHGPFLPVAQAVAEEVFKPEPVEPPEMAGESELESQPQNEPVTRPGASAQDLGIYVEETVPWRVFHEFSDREWEELKPLLPPHMRSGRRRVDDRALLNGIFWVYTTRSRWREMPARYGNFYTAKQRVHRWKEQGIWEPILEKARGFGYALTEGDFVDYQDEDRDDHAGVLSDGDGTGQQARVGPESAGPVPSGSPAEC